VLYTPRPRSWDHPRPCGEQPSCHVQSQPPIGSPPPLRGTGGEGQDAGDKGRITPAPAGNSGTRSTNRLPLRDHPRPCGEQFLGFLAGFSWGGSPPPLRGTGFFHPARHADIRITPAPAGNRSSNSTLSPLLEDHPRPCGEQTTCTLTTIRRLGSPPPLRGTADEQSFVTWEIRITPAPAGNRKPSISIKTPT